jgi:hypothetical protein
VGSSRTVQALDIGKRNGVDPYNLRAEPHRLVRDTVPELVNPLGLLRFD